MNQLKNYILLCDPHIQLKANCILQLFDRLNLHSGNYENLPRILGHNWICGVDIYQLVANINRVRREYGDVDALTVEAVNKILLSQTDNEEE